MFSSLTNFKCSRAPIVEKLPVMICKLFSIGELRQMALPMIKSVIQIFTGMCEIVAGAGLGG